VLPAEALGPHPEWPSIAQIARVERKREVKRKGRWVSENENGLAHNQPHRRRGLAQALLTYNRDHWRIENNLQRKRQRLLASS